MELYQVTLKLRGVLYNASRNARFLISLHPVIFFPLYRFLGKRVDLAVTTKTCVVIEGFPRSANSFSVGAFQASQPKPVSVANHLHAAAQIIKGTRLGIPTILLIRDPVDAVLSLRSLNFQIIEKRDFHNPVLYASIKTYLSQWIKFYKQVKPVNNNYVIGLFDEVISDFGAVVNRVNCRFSTSFKLFEHTSNNVQSVHEILGYHAGPSSRRQDLKQRAKEELESAHCEALIKEANALYQEFIELAHRQALVWSKGSVQ